MRIQNKLFLSLLISSIVTVAILVVFIQSSVSRGMVDYVNKREVEKFQPLIAELASRYSQAGDWQWLEAKPRVLRYMLMQSVVQDLREHHEHNESEHSERHFDRQPKRRGDIAILDQQDKILVSLNFHAKDRTRLPIQWQGNTVGWLSIPHYKNISEGFELVFIDKQRKALLFISLVVLVLSGLVALPLARHFVRPIEHIAQGANSLTQGHYVIQIPVRRNDELGSLARDFNELAMTLEKNESSRKRWVADISHELRTPIAILSGEIEAMIDCIRPLTESGIKSMKEEVDHLAKLVNDLHELSLADIGALHYKKAHIDLIEITQSKLAMYQGLFEQNKLDITFKHKHEQVMLWADQTRFNQLLDNLLTNSCRYTANNGQIVVTIEQDKKSVQVIVEDSAPSVAEQELTLLFDYLYSAERSRNRKKSGSGLGLAICKRIVEAHNGSIQAHVSALGGVAITMQFPLS